MSKYEFLFLLYLLMQRNMNFEKLCKPLFYGYAAFHEYVIIKLEND